jgi:glycosyltransferase involved in cell wall biosynthesis
MPQVSVIIPCYNQAHYLTESVASVQRQTVVDWECIIVNDGSTDQTRSVALSLAKVDERIRLVEQRNRGLAAARNRGLDAATGRYIQFLDADDWLLPPKFELQLAALRSTRDVSFSYTNYERRSTESASFSQPGWQHASSELDVERPLHHLAADWELGLSIPTHCFLFDARFFSEQKIRFDEHLPNHEDWDCWMQILACDPKIYYVHETLAVYRYRAGSMCLDLRRMRKGFLKAIKKQNKLFRNDVEMQAVLSDKLRAVDEQYRDYSLPKHVIRQVRKNLATGSRRVIPEGLRRRLKGLAFETTRELDSR